MAHFGFLVPPWIGHLNPMMVLARAVAARGHDVSVLSLADSESAVRQAGFRFVPFGERHLPVGEWSRRTKALGRLHGDAGSRVTLVMLAAQARAIVDDLPVVLPRLALDGLVMDQVCGGAESVAALLGLPLAVACNALPVHREPSVPTAPATDRARAAHVHPARPRSAVVPAARGRGGTPVARDGWSGHGRVDPRGGVVHAVPPAACQCSVVFQFKLTMICCAGVPPRRRSIRNRPSGSTS